MMIPEECFFCHERPIGVVRGKALCEYHLAEAGYGTITIAPYNAPSLRTLRLRKRADSPPPWYAGRDIGELDYLPLDPLPPAWPPCECCGKPTSTVRNYADGGPRAVCHECTTMLRFAGLDIYAISTSGVDPLPADWHRLALPSQRAAGDEIDRKRVAAGLCRHCGGSIPCWSAFGDQAPAERQLRAG